MAKMQAEREETRASLTREGKWKELGLARNPIFSQKVMFNSKMS